MAHTFQREALFAEVWSSPMIVLAAKYGLSDNGLRKICKALNVPMPKAGHWAKVAVGKAPPPPKLPATAKRTEFHSNPPPKSEMPEPVTQDDAAWLQAHLTEERLPERVITIELSPSKWHPRMARMLLNGVRWGNFV